MKARDLTDKHIGQTMKIAVRTIAMHPGAVGHQHSETLTLVRVEHQPDGRVRVFKTANQYYSVFEADATVELL